MGVILGTEPEVRARVPDATFKRAKDVENSLRSVSFEGSLFEKASAVCDGSNPGDSYTLDFTVIPNVSEPLACHCSCPVGNRPKAVCKHITALLLLRIAKLQEQHSGSEDTANALSDKLNENKKANISEDEGKKEDFFGALEMCEKIRNPIAIQATASKKRVLPAWMNKQPDVIEQKGNRDNVEKPTGRKPRRVTKKAKEEATESKEEEGEHHKVEKATEKKTRKATKKVNEEATESKEEEGEHQTDLNRIQDKGRKRRLVRADSMENLLDASSEKISAKQACPKTSKRLEHTSSDSSEKLTENTRGKRANGRSVETKNKTIKGPAKKRRKNMNEERSDREDYELEKCTSRHHRRTLQLEESDLSEVDQCTEAEGFEASDINELDSGFNLTTDDLISIAQKHLEGKQSSSFQEGELVKKADNVQVENQSSEEQEKRRKPKNDGSIYSADAWKKTPAGSQHAVLDRTNSLSTFTDDPSLNLPPKEPKLMSSDNVAEDMLGLIFGPTLCAKKDQSPPNDFRIVEEISHTSMVSSIDLKLDFEPKPKKKGSLKDQMHLLLA